MKWQVEIPRVNIDELIQGLTQDRLVLRTGDLHSISHVFNAFIHWAKGRHPDLNFGLLFDNKVSQAVLFLPGAGDQRQGVLQEFRRVLQPEPAPVPETGGELQASQEPSQDNKTPLVLGDNQRPPAEYRCDEAERNAQLAFAKLGAKKVALMTDDHSEPKVFVEKIVNPRKPKAQLGTKNLAGKVVAASIARRPWLELDSGKRRFKIDLSGKDAATAARKIIGSHKLTLTVKEFGNGESAPTFQVPGSAVLAAVDTQGD